MSKQVATAVTKKAQGGPPVWKLIDIGLNLTDGMYKGLYHSNKPTHPEDVDAVVARAASVGVVAAIITGGNLEEGREALSLAARINQQQQQLMCFTTVGCHPTRCKEFLPNPKQYLDELRALIAKNRPTVVAIGECGLDYDREHFCPREVQLPFFVEQFKLAEEFKLPMFLHNRNTNGDFARIVKENRSRFTTGVVHSFTGSVEEVDELLALDLFIGVNGCSMKTAENLEALKRIPLNRLMIETDAPWCDVRPTHASYQLLTDHSRSVLGMFPVVKKEKYAAGAFVKSRNEPAHLVAVLDVVFSLRKDEVGGDIYKLAEILFNNTCSVFKLFPAAATVEQ